MGDDRETAPCETCGHPTPMLGTRRCDNCWEVERRLVAYLRSENARERMRRALAALEADDASDR